MNHPIVRTILGAVAGVIFAGVLVGVLEGIGHLIFPPPPGIDISNPADQARLMEVVPTGAKVAVVLAWFLGALGGAALAMAIARRALPGWIVGLVMVALSIVTTQMFPHPIWMVVAAVVLPLVAVLIARRLVAARL